MMLSFILSFSSLIGTILVVEMCSVVLIYLFWNLSFSVLLLIIVFMILDSVLSLSMIVQMARSVSSDKLISFSW